MKEVAGYVTRKSMLYVTGVEYGDYTMNHVLGCAHGCKYPCYAFMMKKRFGIVKSYEDWLKPYLVSNTLEILDKEIPKLRNKIKSVQLSFTTDPFMYGYDEISKMSLQAIQKLNESGLKCVVLTKGILPSELAFMSHSNEYGITLVSLNEVFRTSMEPFSAPFHQRIMALKNLHENGFYTWISMEPYPTPNIVNQDIFKILEQIKFVNKIIFGRTNYSKETSSYVGHRTYYNEMAQHVIDFCHKHGIAYHIKDGTLS